MRVKNLLLVAGTAFVALGTIEMPSVHAAPIPITNPSFEQPSLPKGSFTIENITGWSVINTGNPGVFNPSSTSFDSVPDGNQTMYSNSATVFQQLPATLAPNTTYTLRLQVGRRRDFTNFPGFTVELRAGNTVLASANQTMVPLPEPGKFVPLTLTYTTPSSVPQGQNLEIRLKSAGPQTNFDNVTLDAVSSNQSLNVYKIDVESIYVERDQRTGTINFEGLLELRGRFSANNVTAPEYPTSSSFISLAQGQTANLNYNIANITSSGPLPVTVPIEAKLLELEPGGGQGGTDQGILTDNIVLDGSPVVRKTLRLTISGDNWKERSATVLVTFKATKQ